MLKEYRICMPLTVEEVSAAPGPASPAPGPPPRGCRLPVGESTTGGRETWLEGREEGELLFPLVTPAGEGGVGWGGELQVGPLGAPRVLITGDQNAPKRVGAFLQLSK